MTKPIFQAEADILATTYYHTADVYRPSKTSSNSVFNTFKQEQIYKSLRCAISFTGGSNTGETDTFQAINYNALLFARPEIRILAGDKITANVLGVTYEFLAGEGVIYQSHIEVPMIRKDRA